MTTEQSPLFEPDVTEAADVTENPGADEPPAKLRPIKRQQLTMAPIDVEELIPPDHKARAIWELVGRLDLTAYLQQIESREGGSGRPAWDPRLRVSVWVYALSAGITKAREMERAMAYEPGFRWLTGLSTINYHTLSDFASTGGAAVEELFVKLLGLLAAEKLINLERVMHDGTKVRAAASGNSFRREGTIQAHLEQARALVREMGESNEEGMSRREAARRRTVQEREKRVQRVFEQLQQLQEEESQEEEKRKIRVSLTDPDARIMQHGDGALAPSYNVPISTEAGHGIIVGLEITQCGGDAESLLPAVERVEKNWGAAPQQMVVDGAYCSATNIEWMEQKKIDLIGTLDYEDGRSQAALKRQGVDVELGRQSFAAEEGGRSLRCPAGCRLVYIGDRRTHGYQYRQYRARGEDCVNCQYQPRCCPQKPQRGRVVTMPQQGPAVNAFRQRMASQEAQTIYRARAGIAERPHAWIKDQFGLRRFRVRGLVKVRAEALWAGLTYNILQWVRLVWRKALPVAA